MTVMDAALRESLKALRLSGMLETLDARLAQAHGGELGHLDFLQVLCQDEITRRETVAFQRRLQRAKFEQQVTLEEFDFTASSKLPAAQIRDLVALRWLHAGESVILWPRLWERLKAEPDFRVGNAGAMVLTQRGGGDQAWERWMSTRPWSTLKARHLVSLGGDLVRSQAAQRALGRLLDQAPSGDEFRGVLMRAAEIIQEQLERITLAVEGMSAIEYELLRGRSKDEHFQDGCLATFQKRLLERHQIFSPFLEHETAHGTWGPLPWWSIALHDERERQAAEELLVRGGMQLSINVKNHEADELVITCQEPGLGPSGLAARLRFDLRDAVHACELLLLARRQSVAVDFLTERIDEWDDREVNLVGTLNIAIGDDIGATLADIAAHALRRIMPNASGPSVYGDGNPELDRLLTLSRLPEICRHPR